jgi:hypothetical protein
MSRKCALDIGHGLFKARRDSGGECCIPHAIAAISEGQYLDTIQSYGPNQIPLDYMVINGQAYVVGESAERFGIAARRTGAERYRPDYYGVGAMSVLTRLYHHGSFEVELFCSHPPQHVGYTDSLRQSVLGRWDVTAGGRDYHINVVYCDTFDEPTGGLMNVLLNEQGNRYQNGSILRAKVLVIDIGAGTTDFIVVTAGDIDYGTAQTHALGIHNVVEYFERAFRSRYKNQVKGTLTLDPAKVRAAIIDGVFYGGGLELDCAIEAEQARNILVNRIGNILQSVYGGGFNYDAILLTGGGSALLYNHLLQVIDNQNIIPAEDLETLHFANVRGGIKLWRLYEQFAGA